MSTETANFILDFEAYLLIAIQVGALAAIVAGIVTNIVIDIKKDVAARRHRGAP